MRRQRQSIVSNVNWRARTNTMFVILVLVSLVSMVAVGVTLGQWVRDGRARKLVTQAQEMLEIAVVSILSSQRIAQEITQQKEQTEQFQSQVSDLMGLNSQYETQIDQIDVNETVQLWNSVNNSFAQKNETVHTSIAALNRTLQQIRSNANALLSTEELLASGTCQLIGIDESTASVSFSFYRQNLTGVILHFYRFGTSDAVLLNSTLEHARIANCDAPILGGVPQTGPTITANLDRFTSSPTNWVAGVLSNGDELKLLKNENVTVVGSGSLQISSPFTFWLQFF